MLRSCLHLYSNSPLSKWSPLFMKGWRTGILVLTSWNIIWFNLQTAKLFFGSILGQLLNFNIALALLLTLKHTATKLRRHSTVRGLFPLDDLLCLHKTVAYIAVFLSCLHMVAHVIHACKLSKIRSQFLPSLWFYFLLEDWHLRKYFIWSFNILGEIPNLRLLFIYMSHICHFVITVDINKLHL